MPGELMPLVNAMNRLLVRVSDSIEHERRLTADAAHEMRTPLAALKAQWEIAQRSPDEGERARAQRQCGVRHRPHEPAGVATADHEPARRCFGTGITSKM
ncbi:histidine kinase dimerization/phospho-acceptor domain-containing protein [Cupriavidus basilensis]